MLTFLLIDMNLEFHYYIFVLRILEFSNAISKFCMSCMNFIWDQTPWLLLCKIPTPGHPKKMSDPNSVIANWVFWSRKFIHSLLFIIYLTPKLLPFYKNIFKTWFYYLSIHVHSHKTEVIFLNIICIQEKYIYKPHVLYTSWDLCPVLEPWQIGKCSSYKSYGI